MSYPLDRLEETIAENASCGIGCTGVSNDLLRALIAVARAAKAMHDVPATGSELNEAEAVLYLKVGRLEAL